jgi:hypothetical protein
MIDLVVGRLHTLLLLPYLPLWEAAPLIALWSRFVWHACPYQNSTSDRGRSWSLAAAASSFGAQQSPVPVGMRRGSALGPGRLGAGSSMLLLSEPGRTVLWLQKLLLAVAWKPSVLRC